MRRNGWVWSRGKEGFALHRGHKKERHLFTRGLPRGEEYKTGKGVQDENWKLKIAQGKVLVDYEKSPGRNGK